MLFMFRFMSMDAVIMEYMHQRTEKNEDERCVCKNMLPMIHEGKHHDAREEEVEPTWDMKGIHGCRERGVR
ncbi:hypothetical protein A3D88_03540 [Candidatus Peribacteria bacterium RIFCSPHIGHO2_02_FULL_52_16]|nr:MAG: hypothetical protein A2706_04355 [Candidatus Peribacteria bacterium RIFCSPHIGHO2_01_FULL_51_35]OGJ61758.1 MAG: hypothetical protein A3D88_03540 [Candidatus Peribacteria bacterium RIFCSPHIGHO2_02_FULL_52_16]